METCRQGLFWVCLVYSTNRAVATGTVSLASSDSGQTGPRGYVGPRGPVGPAGSSTNTGAAGPQGATGPTVPAFRTVNVQEFTTAGSFTYTPSVGMLGCEVILQGTGGGSSSATAGAVGTFALAGSGGAGGYCQSYFSASALTPTVSVVIAAGGAGGAAPNGAGGSASNSTFGLMIAGGGSGGGVAQSGTANSTPVKSLPGNGGSAIGANILSLTGETGWLSSGISMTAGGVFISYGHGGNSSLGSGGSEAFFTPTGYGSGGYGGASIGGGAAYVGNAGTNGICIIKEYIQ